MVWTIGNIESGRENAGEIPKEMKQSLHIT